MELIILKKYIGEIRLNTGHYNFFPKSIYVNDKIQDLSNEEKYKIASEDYHNIALIGFNNKLSNLECFNNKSNDDIGYYCIIEFDEENGITTVPTKNGKERKEIDYENYKVIELKDEQLYRYINISKTFNLDYTYDTTYGNSCYNDVLLCFNSGVDSENIVFVGEYHIDTNKNGNKVWCPTNYGFINKYELKNSSSQDSMFFVNINDLNCNEDNIDVLPDDMLLQHLSGYLSRNTDIGFSNSDIDKLKNLLLTKNIDNKYLNSRKNKVIEKIDKLIGEIDKYDDIMNSIISYVLSHLNYDNTIRFFKHILESDIFIKQIKDIQIIKDEIMDLERQKNELNEELDVVKKQKEKENQNIIENAISKKQIEIADLNSTIANKEKEVITLEQNIDELQNKYNKLCEFDNIETSIAEKRGSLTELKNQENELKNQKNEIENEIKQKLNDVKAGVEEVFKNDNPIKNYIDRSFTDGIVEDAFIKAANNYDKKQKRESLNAFCENYKKIYKDESRCINNLSTVIDNVTPIRDINKNDIINTLLCLKTGFITIFSGKPGCGKTSFCAILANSLGLNDINLDSDTLPERYVEISVEKGWTNKRDFIGYYNPFTQDLVCNNQKVINAFKLINEEALNKKEYPFIMMLDEANLSPMEFYWADFINVCDLDKRNRTIVIGDGVEYNISKGLRFLATINTDHTTETLSPRLIDRAWIINLDKKSFDINTDSILNNNNNNLILSDWENLFSTYDIDDFKDKEKYKKFFRGTDDTILELYDKLNVNISARSLKMIDEYLKSYRIFEDMGNDGIDPFDIALDYTFSQKILTQINGSESNYGENIEKLKNKLSESGLSRSYDIIDRILKKGNNENMGFYTYFV